MRGLHYGHMMDMEGGMVMGQNKDRLSAGCEKKSEEKQFTGPAKVTGTFISLILTQLLIWFYRNHVTVATISAGLVLNCRSWLFG